MEDFDALSNEELQYRLRQYGLPNMPVTTTTRKVLVKKLRNHVQNEKSKLRRDTSYVTRYSSDEDSDAQKTNTAAKKRGAYARSTIAVTVNRNNSSFGAATNRSSVNMPPPTVSPSQKHLNLRTESEKHDGVGRANKSSNLIYVSPLIQQFDTDEESDSNQTDGSFSSRYRTNFSTGISSRASISGRSSTLYDHEIQHGINGSGRYSNIGIDGGSQNSSAVNSSSAGSSTNNEHEYDDDFTKRLLSFRNRNIGSTINAPPLLESPKRFDRFSSPSYNYYLNELHTTRLSRDNNIVYQAARVDSSNQRPSLAARTTFSQFFSRFKERYGVKQSLVPCILLSALFIFFASVIIAYLTMNPDLSLTLDPNGATYKLCPINEIGFSNTQPTVNCMEKSELKPAFDLLKLLIPELQKRIEFNRCTDSSAVFAMSAKEVVQFVLESKQQHSAMDTIRTLHNVEYLISMNPQWRVGHFMDASGQSSSSISLTDLSRFRPTQSNYFAIVKPRLPVTCFLYNKLQTVFVIIGWIALIAVIGLGLVFAFRYIRSHLQTRRERLTNMVDDIINVLMEKAYDPDTACTDAASVVINHLRDKLIPAAERSKMESVWNAAIRFIEQNESRVQFSVATRNGEDYRVMRWIDTISPVNHNSLCLGNSLSSSNSTIAVSVNNASTTFGPRSYASGNGSVKKWQSPAFDKTNKIKDPPTECLKIRQMFDKYESNRSNLKQIIQDAILEKVAHTTCKIYDIQLDTQTCCVYVRCATAKDAGIIHDEVNGWWFDSRLVSIKFLRLDRYLNRFPNAASGPVGLKPSNTKNLSMINGDDKQSANQNGKRGADSLADDDDDDDIDDDMDTDGGESTKHNYNHY